MRFKLRMGVSGRHCHLKREDMDILFGKGSELHPIKPIVQPGQFTCEEKIILVTDKGEMPLRVIGPLRPYTQIELAKTDARQQAEPAVASPVILTAHSAANRRP